MDNQRTVTKAFGCAMVCRVVLKLVFRILPGIAKARIQNWLSKQI